MSWRSVRIVTAVSVFGLTWLVCPAIEAQHRGLFSPIEGAATELNSPAPASLDATTLRSRVVTMDLDRLHRSRATALPVRPFKAKPHLRAAAVVTRRLHQMQP